MALICPSLSPGVSRVLQQCRDTGRLITQCSTVERCELIIASLSDGTQIAVTSHQIHQCSG